MTDNAPHAPPQHAYKPTDWEAEFLSALRNSGNVRLSCQKAGIERSTAYRRRLGSKTFEKLWSEAMEDAVDTLEAAAWKRARDGTTRHHPIYYQGEKIGEEVITEYSDTLMVTLLKAHRPAVYRETTRNLNINITPEQAAKMTNEEIDELLRKEGLL